MISTRSVIAVALVLVCVLTVAGCSSGAVSSSPTTTAAQSQEDYLCPIPVDAKWGFMDDTGKVVIEPRFYNLQPMFRGDLAAVQLEQDGPWGYIDQTGKMIIEPRFVGAGRFFGGVAWVAEGDSEGSWIYIDKTGKTIWRGKLILPQTTSTTQ
jgi:hypothetical protein